MMKLRVQGLKRFPTATMFVCVHCLLLLRSNSSHLFMWGHERAGSRSTTVGEGLSGYE